jgi:hypothetical protein
MPISSFFICCLGLLSAQPGDTVKLKSRSHQYYTVRDTFSGPYFVPNNYDYHNPKWSTHDPEMVYYISSYPAGSNALSFGTNVLCTGTNVGWLLLISPFDCDLTFEIIPVDTSADFAFSLYKYRKGIHANLLIQNEARIKPDRQNTTPNLSNKGVIGLSMLATEKNLPIVHNDKKARPYSKFINVNSGDSLLLAVGVYRNKEITDPFYFRIKYHNKSF